MKQRVPFTALSDRQWEALRPYVLAQKTSPAGRKLPDLRERMNAILFLLSTDAPWRELPERYGPSVHRLAPFPAAVPWRALGTSSGSAARPRAAPSPPAAPPRDFPGGQTGRETRRTCASLCWRDGCSFSKPCLGRPGCCPIRICPKPWRASSNANSKIRTPTVSAAGGGAWAAPTSSSSPMRAAGAASRAPSASPWHEKPLSPSPRRRGFPCPAAAGGWARPACRIPRGSR